MAANGPAGPLGDPRPGPRCIAAHQGCMGHGLGHTRRLYAASVARGGPFWPVLGHPGPARRRNQETAVSRARRPELRIRGHFSGVPPPRFGGFHTSNGPQRAASTPYRPPDPVFGQFGPTPGSAKRPKTEKRPYLGLGAPNRKSKGNFLGYHPPGLVVSTRQMGPNARLAPRTGRWDSFWANSGPNSPSIWARMGPKMVKIEKFQN